MSLERDGQRPNCVVCLGYEKFFGLVLFVVFFCLFILFVLYSFGVFTLFLRQNFSS